MPTPHILGENVYISENYDKFIPPKQTFILLFNIHVDEKHSRYVQNAREMMV